MAMEYYVGHKITSPNVRCSNADYLIRKLSKKYRQNLREYGILWDYEYKFSFGRAIRRAVEWFNSDLCRSFRRAFYDGEKYFRLQYDKGRIPNLLFHGTSYELGWDIRINGLQPRGGDGKVYLTDNIFVAHFYACNRVCIEAAKNRHPIIFVVDTRDFKCDLEAGPEFYAKKDYDGMPLALLPHMQFKYSGTIDAQKLAGDFVPPEGPKDLSMLIQILKNVPDLTFEEQKEIEYFQKLLDRSHE